MRAQTLIVSSRQRFGERPFALHEIRRGSTIRRDPCSQGRVPGRELKKQAERMNPAQAPPHEAGFVRRGLLALVGTVCRFPRTVLALSAALCALSLYAAFFHLEYRTQRSDLISPRKECQQRWRNYVQEFGDDDDIVAVVRGSDRGRMIAALEQVADRLRRQPALFDRLFYKADLRALHDRALLMLPREEIAKIRQNLGGDMTLLLSAANPDSKISPWRWLTVSSLLLKGELTLPPGRPLNAEEVQFYTELEAVARAAGAYLDDPGRYSNPWGSLMSTRPAGQEDLLAEPQYFFSGSGGLAFLLVRPKKEQGSFTAALKSVEAMRGVVAEARASFPDLEFGLTGMPVLETDEMAAAQHDTQWASWLAVAGVALLFLVVYRGVAYPPLTLVTLLVGTAWALGWLTLTVGHLNILSATFAVMLIGMGDYGVLWVMRYEQARRQGADVRSALLHTTTHVAVGNLTAAMTLALAFYAAVLADFQAVAELGWIAGCGVLLCAFACFTVLPSLLMLFDRRRLAGPAHGGPLAPRAASDSRSESPTMDAAVLPLPGVSPRPAADDSWLPFLARRPAWVVAGGAALLAALGFCATRVSYDHNLLHLQAQDLESVRWEMTLIQRDGRGQLARHKHRRQPGEGPGAQGPVRKAAGSQPRRRGGDADPARPGRQAPASCGHSGVPSIPAHAEPYHRTRPAGRPGAARRADAAPRRSCRSGRPATAPSGSCWRTCGSRCRRSSTDSPRPTTRQHCRN